MLCNICPRHCNVDREKYNGYCLSGNIIRIARAAPHFWEEPCISGINGSGAVFFSGCNLRCVFCQNYDVSHCSYGQDISLDKLLKIFDSLVSKGVHNINLVTPTHYTPIIAKALLKFNSPVPVVWNSSGYESIESLKMLDGLVDIYLPDIKYYDSDVSLNYSAASDYFDVCSKAVSEMFRQVGLLKLDEKGIAKSGIIIRHLVLPGNVEQTFKIFEYIKDNYPLDIAVSLMRQYTPYGKALDMPPLNRKLSLKEYIVARNFVMKCGFNNIYIQQAESADTQFIPQFNLEGIDL